VTGKREPTAEEAVWKLDANEGEEKDDVKALATQMEAQIDLKERGEFVGKQSQRMIYGYRPRSSSGIFSFFGVVVLSFGINEENARSLNFKLDCEKNEEKKFFSPLFFNPNYSAP